jgi:hypothetical protein
LLPNVSSSRTSTLGQAESFIPYFRYRRDALILHADSEVPESGVGYVIGAVVTPSKHRGNGYARRMLSLLHYALAPHVHPQPDITIDIPLSVLPASFSTLYSDIGNYYERCGPSAEESGWKITSPISTTWEIPEALSLIDGSQHFAMSHIKVHKLYEEEVTALLASDIPDFNCLPRTIGTTYIAFAPSAPLNQHLITRSIMNPQHRRSESTYWGAHIPSTNHFISWSYDYGSPRTLQITRFKADSDTFLALLLAALQAGQSQGCQMAEAWNMPKEFQQMVESSGGMTGKRARHLPAFHWYGPKPVKDTVWLMNE